MAAKQWQVKMIEDIYESVPEMQRGFLDYKQEIYDITVESERRHQRGRPSHMKSGCSVDIASKYFVIKWLRDAVVNNDQQVDASLSLVIRREVVMAIALNSNSHFRKVLLAWFEGTKWELFNALDYCSLVG